MTTPHVAGVVRRAAAGLDAPDAPDGPLLDRFSRHADHAAFARLVRRHGPMVLGVCRRVLGNAADADDAFQAVFLVLARRAGELAGRAAVGNFLYGVAVHTALKAKAMAAKRRAREAAAARPESADPPADADWRPAFDRELAALPEKYREPLVLHELEGLPRKVVAARLGVPDGTLSSRLATAKRMLAARLTRAGLPAAAVAVLGEAGRAAVPAALAAAAVRAADGGAAAEVLTLAREVSVMLLAKKLKFGAAAGVVAAAVGVMAFAAAPRTAAEPPPKEAPEPERKAAPTDQHALLKQVEVAADALRGTWELESQTRDGKPQADGDPGSWWLQKPLCWTFAATRVTLEQKGDDRRDDRFQSMRFQVNPRTSPAQLTVFGDVTLFQCIYKLDGDKLTMAMFGPQQAGERPAGFTKAENPIGLALFVQVYRRVKEPQTAAAGLKSLEGIWEVKAVTEDGRNATKDVENQRVTVTDGYWSVEGLARFKLRTDVGWKPPGIDLTAADSLVPKKAAQGIYQLERGVLQICVARPGHPRPTEFDAPAGSHQTLYVLERVMRLPSGR